MSLYLKKNMIFDQCVMSVITYGCKTLNVIMFRYVCMDRYMAGKMRYTKWKT